MGNVKCPSCQGTHVERTAKGTATKAGASVVGFGAGMAAQAAAQAVFGVEHVQKSMVSNWVASLPSIQHVCLDCYQMFNVKFDSDGNVKSVSKDTKYDVSEIQAEKDKVVKEKDEIYEKAKKGVTIHILLAVVSAIYAVCCFAYPAAIILGIILCLCFIFAAISKNSKANECKAEVEKYKNMSLNEYRYKFM